MLRDILFIVATAFALFGVYCFVEFVVNMFAISKFPSSVTVIKNCNDDLTFKKMKYVQENIPNNYIVFYPFDNETNESLYVNFEEYIKGVFEINNK